jgi:LysM repeat protein
MRRRLAFLLAGGLLVVACGGGATPTPELSPSATPAPTDLFAETPVPSEIVSPAPEVSAAPSLPAGETTYRVKAGDIMINIAKKFGITVAALKAANPTVDPTKMRVGSTLIIPAP